MLSWFRSDSSVFLTSFSLFRQLKRQVRACIMSKIDTCIDIHLYSRLLLQDFHFEILRYIRDYLSFLNFTWETFFIIIRLIEKTYKSL